MIMTPLEQLKRAFPIVKVSRYESDSRMPQHYDGSTRLSVVLGGQVAETNGQHEVHPGIMSVALKSAEALHATRFGPEGAQIASIDLDALSVFDVEGFRTGSIPGWCWAQAEDLLPEIRALVSAIIDYRRFPDLADSWDGLAEASVLLMDGIRRGRGPNPKSASQWLDVVREHIDEAPHQPVSIVAMARAAGVSPTHLTRRFRSAFGLSVTAYRNLRRVQRAVRQLAVVDASLVDVAVDCGFHDQSHFTHHFRSVTGVPPGAWRRDLAAP